ncbi:LAME_0A01354g1_1 [Lachancea meyersii CBS 8951]|uniref:LAME_0A01354g1_1 n=1 Tax=Lachancea meyersii CBS 8951 TaxID=1266667 RepID=A0A1G4ILQ1_9SACH|nr:LAME_0A01354g1_1 [Lachancea meyersii CBS 8951]
MKLDCLNDSPKDYVSSLLVIPENPHVVAAAWDGTVSLYDYEKNRLLARMQHDCGILSSTLTLGGKICVGSVQGEILEVDVESGKFDFISDEAALGVSAMSSSNGNIVSGSWDGSLRVIDPRTGHVWQNSKLENRKVLALDSNDDVVVVACTGGKVALYDFRNMEKPVIQDSGLKFQTRDIKLMPLGNGYAQSSVDGRVAVEYFDNESQRLAFRCHRMNLSDTQFVFPVNSLAFSSKTSRLYTGGSDGNVFAWNLETRKKTEQLIKIQESVVKLATHDDMLFVAATDDSFKTMAAVQDVEVPSSQIYFTKL